MWPKRVQEQEGTVGACTGISAPADSGLLEDENEKSQRKKPVNATSGRAGIKGHKSSSRPTNKRGAKSHGGKKIDRAQYRSST